MDLAENITIDENGEPQSDARITLFNPTHGLDAEATERLYTRLKRLSKNGTKVIIGNQ